MVSLSLVSSHFSHYYDVKHLRALCDKHDIKIFIDLAHALGSVPVHLYDLEVDAAVMSTSKFLNSGPGSIGGIYIHPRHKGVKSGMRGWFGTERAVLTLQNPEYTPSK